MIIAATGTVIKRADFSSRFKRIIAVGLDSDGRLDLCLRNNNHAPAVFIIIAHFIIAIQSYV